jgi:hypothetical protein
VLVIGSQSPWIESILISLGAGHVTTFDYVKIDNKHPKISTLTPDELSKYFFKDVKFDLMITFSSVEHSGLGRCFYQIYILVINILMEFIWIELI